ncbi:MAG: lysophospholipid acyltransferase family protein [Bacteroidota bacterium]
MKTIKNIGNAIYSVYSLVVFFSLAVIALFLYLFIAWLPERKRLVAIFRINSVWQATWCLLTGVRVKVLNPEGRDPSATYVFVANHSNMLDILIAGGSIIHPYRPLAKKELFYIPIMGWVLRFMCLGVDRKSIQNRRRSFQNMIKKLEKGVSILIFPEGTRNRTSEPLKSFYDGAFRLSIETGFPILPIVFLNARSLQPVDTIRLYPGKIFVKYLDPIDPVKEQIAETKALKELAFSRMYAELEVESAPEKAAAQTN